MRLPGLSALLATMIAAMPAAAALSPAERRMAEVIAAEEARSLALLERMVNVNSGTNNLEGVEQAGRMTAAELEPLGFAVRWVDKRATGRAGHLIATHEGRPGTKRLLLIGHLDTVFEKTSPFQRFERRGDRVSGPGVNDMKGGNVIMIAALRAMQAAGTLKDANIAVIFTGDEESVGRPRAQARAELMEMGRNADVALEFESLAKEDGRDMGSIARRSSTAWTLRTKGRTGHSSAVFSDRSGFGANYELTRILDAFRRDLREPSLTYNVGLIAGGTPATLGAAGISATVEGKSNIIAAEAVARGDIRALSNDQLERTEAKMRAIVAQSLPGTSAEITFDEGYPAMPPTEGSRALLARLNAINADLGLAPMAELDPLKRGAGDIAYVGHLPGLIGLGAAGGGSHAEGEDAEVASYARQARRAAILMSRLSREKR